MNNNLAVNSKVNKILIYIILLLLPLIMALIIRNTTHPMGFGDTDRYLLMSENMFQFTSSPFGYRILIPYLASFISWIASISIDTSYFVLSLFCFELINITIILWALKLGHSVSSSMLLSMMYAFSYAGVYNLHNYVHIGFFEHLLILLGIIAIYHKRFLYLCLIIIVGCFVKETVIILIPIYFICNCQNRNYAITIKRVSILIGIYFGIFFFLRSGIIFSNDVSFSSYTAFYTLDYIRYVYDYIGGYLGALKGIFIAYLFLWPLSFIGLMYSKKSDRIISILIPLSILQILLAVDISRVTVISFPAIILLVGNFFKVTRTFEKVSVTGLSILTFYLYNYYINSKEIAILMYLTVFLSLIIFTIWYIAILRKRIKIA